MSSLKRMILYMGGPVQSRQRLIFSRTPLTPRTLVVSLRENKQRLRTLLHEHGVRQPVKSLAVRSLFTADHVCFAAHGDETKMALRGRQFDHIIVANINEMFGRQEGLMDWLHQLGDVFAATQASVTIDLAGGVVYDPLWWEASLKLQGLGEADMLGLWISTSGSPVRYLRLETRALQILTRHYIGKASSPKDPIALFPSQTTGYF